ncbi:translocation and assembly module TamB [bacterium BMS3Bbin12]|nr:translocation and assembly module TamB [bacterium BMS3Bbin12]GBE50529.1 translocation and assembly module TamB [bacterium BMS3Bbin13]
MNRRTTAFVLLGVLAALCGALVFLVATTTGARWSLALAGTALRGDLRVERVSGRLLGPLELDGVRYRSGAGAVAIRRLVLEWRPRALFRNTVHITRLTLDGVSVRLPGAHPGPSRATAPAALHPPVTLIVDEASVRGLTVRRGAAAPLHLDEIVLHARAGPRRIRITRLHVRAPRGALTVTGTLALRRPFPVDLRLRWTLRLKDHPPVEGTGRIHGTLMRLAFEQRVTGALRMRLHGRIDEPLGARRWRAEVRLPALDPQQWNPDWPRATITARLRAQGVGADFRLTGTAGVAPADAPKVRARFHLAHRNGRWRLAPLVATAPGGRRITVDGTWNASSGAARGRLRARWNRLAWPIAGTPVYTSRSGNLEVEGTPGDYRFRLAFRLGGRRIPAGDWRASGRGDRNGLLLQNLAANLLDGRVSGSGSATWRPRRDLDLNLHAADLDPGARWPEWPGKLSADVHLSGRLRDGRLQARLHIASLRGTLRDYPVRGDLQGGVDGRGLTLPRFAVRVGDARVWASGAVGMRWALRWRVRAPHLAALLPGASGDLSAEGSLRGVRAAPIATASLRAGDVRIGSAAAKAFDARIEIGIRDDQPVHVAITAEDLRSGAFHATRAGLTVTGTAARQDWNAKLVTPTLRAAIDATGGWSGARWRGRLKRAEWVPEHGTPWRLAGGVPITLGGGAVKMGRACWRGGDGRLCAAVQGRRGGGWRVTMQARRLPLAAFDPLLVDDARLSGTLDADARLDSTAAGILTGAARLRAGPGLLRYPAAAGGGRIGYRAIVAHLRLRPDTLQGRLDLALADGDSLGADLTLGARGARGPWRRRALRGTVRANFRHLAWIGLLFPQMQKVHGNLKADLRLAGRARHPVLTGRAALTDAGAELPALGIRLTELQIRAHGTGANAVTVTGGARSGKGRLAISGAARPGPGGRWDARLRVTGNDFEAVDLPSARAWISPALDLRIAGRDLHLSGTVRMPRASLDLRMPRSAVHASPDVVIVGAARPATPPTAWRIHARLRLVLGDRVRFRAHGFEGGITGRVLAIDEPGKPTLGQGELKIVDGIYKAYGQELKIVQGRLLFAGGPIDDPGLDLESVRQVGDVTAGIRVRGTVKRPKLTLFSTPPLSQSDILSYFLLGRPVDQASAAQGAALSNAATSLGLGGANLLLGRLGSLLDLQEAQIESGGIPTTPAPPTVPGPPPGVANAGTSSATSGPSASLVLGKYLSPRLYVQYTTSLFQPGNIFRVRYKLSRRWSMVTETGVESGIDFLYMIER